jgi:16S rRNA (guanine527-N7)-methyltransferase
LGLGSAVLEQAGREVVLATYNVSRETSAKLDVLVGELERWQAIKNLVGPGTLREVWSRHIADSLQLLALEPAARRWLDLGSGAGFPGLVIAIALAEKGGHVDLVESNGRKCAFLRHVARLTGALVTVHERRLETAVDGFAGKVEVVTARALAPLPQLVQGTQALLKTGTVGLFLKGRDVQAELTEAANSWRLATDLIPSRTDSQARIVRIRSLHERA